MKNEKATKLEISKITNIIYESPDRFETSVLCDAYERAFEISKEIVQENWDLNQAKRNRAKGTELRNSEQICNIIFFTGDRGTGKTSAMLSFMEFLKDYYREAESTSNIFKKLNFGNKRVMFTGLEHIDASLLEGKEDILGTVLSKMAKKWYEEEQNTYRNSNGIIQDVDYDYKKRKIQMHFNRVYECLKSLKTQDEIVTSGSDMFMETLQKLSYTENLKQAFQELVIQYLGIMSYPGTSQTINFENHFLIISIDDLDMDIKHSYKLLDQIRKYLMVPQVIVLLSANYEQLENICKNHYSEEYSGIIDKNEIIGYIEKLSREYLQKIVPIQRQVELKSGKKWKYFEREKIEISYPDENGKPERTSKHENLQSLVRKRFKEEFNVEFGEKSKALFYLTPITLRDVTSWLNRVPYSKRQKTDEVEESSYEWFWNEEFPIVCKKYLNTKEYKIFQGMDQLGIIGQIKAMNDITGANNYNPQKTLLERFSELQDGTQEEQAISALGIIYFTMKISEIVLKITNKEDDNENIKKLKSYFNGGIWGKWEEKFIEKMSVSFGTDGNGNSPLGFETTQIARTEFLKDNSCLQLDLEGGEDLERDNVASVIRFIEKNKDKFINYQYLLLFYNLNETVDTQEGMLWKLVNNNRIVLTKEQGGIFSLSNSILSIMTGCELSEKFIIDLNKILYIGDSEAGRGKINQIISNLSIAEKMGKKILLPVSNVDYLIDTGLKIRNKLGKTAVFKLEQDNVNEKVRMYFHIIEKTLEDYEKLYSEGWKKNFNNNPLIKAINENNEFLQMLYASIKCHSNVQKKESKER